jgi:hypothetical protein
MKPVVVIYMRPLNAGAFSQREKVYLVEHLALRGVALVQSASYQLN